MQLFASTRALFVCLAHSFQECVDGPKPVFFVRLFVSFVVVVLFSV